jgi:hypothetical protein
VEADEVVAVVETEVDGADSVEVTEEVGAVGEVDSAETEADEGVLGVDSVTVDEVLLEVSRAANRDSRLV